MELDEDERRIVDLADKHGWAVMRVSPSVGDLDPHPRWFAYTVGLSVAYRWPELICFGLSQDVMIEMIHNAVRELKAAGSEPLVGGTLCDVIEDFPIRLVDFPERHFRTHLGWATWFANRCNVARNDFHCLQLSWPDKAGHYPSDAACADGVRECQTPGVKVN